MSVCPYFLQLPAIILYPLTDARPQRTDQQEHGDSMSHPYHPATIKGGNEKDSPIETHLSKRSCGQRCQCLRELADEFVSFLATPQTAALRS
ncbi:hypothetical protein BaRGS_00024666 [Batillaria attramentaria]|uniref:Uncharacterized protein n=1 Tax=Batillaria attramentaria TaxID=370345 RepID=A0ABD0KAE0_9CAEN